jgi:pimeloyl-ACP methyl ester carboxylesterase
LANARCGYLGMRSIFALRDRFALVVLASWAICLAPAAFALDIVPEDRSQPSDRTIQNFVLIVPAQSGKSAPDPVIYLGTGPGGIASIEAASVVDAGVNRNRDLVVMNQRGQFLSIPSLTCAPIDDFARRLLGLRFYSESTKRIHLRATAECHRELIASGADLPSYNSSENAADFADLRTVLGIHEWNILGVSGCPPMFPLEHIRQVVTIPSFGGAVPIYNRKLYVGHTSS